MITIRGSALSLLLFSLVFFQSGPKQVVGEKGTEMSVQDLQGRPQRLSSFLGKGPTVLVFLGCECPAVPRYAPRLNRLYEQFRSKGVQFLGIYSNGDETREAVLRHVERMGFRFPIVRDPQGAVARSFGATHTPQVIVLDANKKVRYNGAIDSSAKQETPQHAYLRDALSALVSGKPVRVARTPVIGCFIKPSPTPAGKGEVTFAEHIAPILYQNCTPCHRQGDIGAFPLLTYEDARRWSREIQYYTQRRVMPPWKPVPGYGEFRGERYLSEEQLRLITRWVESGTPAGDLGKAPKPPVAPSGWAMGTPDLIAEMPEEYEVTGTGPDEYRYFVIPVEVPPGSAMEGIDIQPGSREVVHHANVYVDVTGVARRLDAADPKPGYSNFGSPGFVPVMMLGGWVPGMRPMRLTPGYGVILPTRFDLVLQVHYFKRGQTYKDRTKVGLYFSKASKVKPVQLAVLSNTKFTIPAGAQRYEIRAQWKVPKRLEAVAIMAHMHLLAREVQVTAQTPDNRSIPMLWIKDWDFNWQETYFYRNPVELPKGTLVTAVGYYDNSEQNPRNPNHPPQPVKYGDKTTDEMFYVFIAVVDEEANRSGLILAGQ